MTEREISTERASITSIDEWASLKNHTTARIALGRTGASLPTNEVLNFGLAHAQAKDAVHLPLDAGAVSNGVQALGFKTVFVESAAPSRESYLRRPDLGRKLSDDSRILLQEHPQPQTDLGIVIGDGLSSSAIHQNVEALLQALKPILEAKGFSVAPIAIARNARVALADEVGALMNVRAVLMLIGERPGLSSPDSLGAYLTFAPKVGPQRCRPQLRLQHPPGRPFLWGGPAQAHLADRGSVPHERQRRAVEG